jgi:hypothetical protein
MHGGGAPAGRRPTGLTRAAPGATIVHMSLTRIGEAPGSHFRSDRCVHVNGAWYVATREGVDVGPYRSRERAQTAAAELTRKLARAANPWLARSIIETFGPPRWVVR